MALDITGISNENEFYTSHYIAAVLETTSKAFLRNGTVRKRKKTASLRSPN